MKVAILIDEINAMSQLHKIGIEGIRPWKKFYESIYSVLKRDYGDFIKNVSYHFYGAIPPVNVDKERYFLRKKFFEALARDGIHVHKGFVYSSRNGLQEKGVDVLLSLDLFEFSLKQYDLLFVFSADGDIAPAVERARKNGSKVAVILSNKQPALMMKKVADAIVPLESIVNLIDERYLVHKTQKILKESVVV